MHPDQFVSVKPFHLLHVTVYLSPVDGQDELVVHALPDEPQQHEGQGNIMRMKRSVRAQLLDSHMTSPSDLGQVLQHYTLPITVVGNPPQVRERFLRCSWLLLYFRTGRRSQLTSGHSLYPC